MRFTAFYFLVLTFAWCSLLVGCAGSGETTPEGAALGGSVTVALIDTGVPAKVDAFDGFDIDYDDSAPVGAHATMMMSVILGVNASGAERIDAKTIRIKCYSVPNGGADGLAEAINQALTDKAQILSISMGTRVSSQRLEQAVEPAADSGVDVYAAAGNVPFLKADYPARLKGVISVGAIDSNGDYWEDSCRDPIDLTALGVDVPAINERQEIEYISGTSVATAMAVRQKLARDVSLTN
ncbi:S8 family peptidase [Bifidobacterium sp.]|uniref:S8 family peptidase n=1 Tax=Bifidobacterium sp. TaxID=41200 RepID=UPI0039EC8D8F